MRYVCILKCWHNGTMYRPGMELKSGNPPMNKAGIIQHFTPLSDNQPPAVIAQPQAPAKKVRGKAGRPKKRK